MRTIRHMLIESTSAPPLVSGSEANVFEFPPDLPDLKPYLIRQPKDFNQDWVRSASALTPPNKAIHRMHIGQPLLHLDTAPALTILPRQSGISLYDWHVAESKRLEQHGIHGDENKYRTLINLCDLILSFEDKRGNPFVSMFETTYALGVEGYGHDVSAGNIFIDLPKQRLELIDQLNDDEDFRISGKDGGIWNVEGAMHCLGHELTYKKAKPHPELQRMLDARITRINTLMEDAKNVVLSMHASELAPTPAFRRTTNTEAVALLAPPHHLVEALRQNERALEIPRR